MTTDLADKKNYEYCEITIYLKKQAEGFFLSLGERLARIRQREMYKPQWDSFGEFCNEMSWSESTASKLITLWIKLVRDWEIDNEKLLEIGSWDTLYRIAAQSETKEQALALMEKIEPQMPAHRRITLTSHKKGINPDKCKHPNAYLLKICPDCGLRERIYEPDN